MLIIIYVFIFFDCRIFQGVRPSLVVYDLDFIREVLVKKFSSFMNRVGICFCKVFFPSYATQF